MRKKTKDKKCIMAINKEFVTLVIETEGDIANKYIVSNDKEPRVNFPLPDVERLMENMKYFASHGLCDGTVEGNLKYYITSREKEINVQVNEIRKSIKRIERGTQCINIVKGLLQNQ